MVKFYLSTRSARVTTSGRTFDFEPADYFEPTNSWWCIYRAEDPIEIAILSAAVSQGLIEEISEADYDHYESKKKITPFLGNIVHLKNRHVASNSMATGKPAVVVEGTEQPKQSAPVEAVSDVLAVKPVTKAPSRRK